MKVVEELTQALRNGKLEFRKEAGAGDTILNNKSILYFTF